MGLTMWYDNDIGFCESILILAFGYILFAALFIPLIYIAYLLQDGTSF